MQKSKAVRSTTPKPSSHKTLPRRTLRTSAKVPKQTKRQTSTQYKKPHHLSFGTSRPSQTLPLSSFSTSSTSTSPPPKVKHSIRPRRSLLYIPGSSLKMLGKASGSGADTVCLDVEDGVALSSKALARKQISEYLSAELASFPANMEVCLRINAVSSGEEYKLDVEWLDSLPFAPHSIALPKMDTVSDFTTFLPVLKRMEAKHNAKIELIGMIESPMAVINLPLILSTSLEQDNHNHLTALIFGGDDYSSMSGCLRTETNHELDFPRAMVQMHAAMHQIGCLDIVCKEFKHPTRFTLESQRSVEQGFIGRQCIHPSQIAPANEIYAPTKENFEWSQGVLEEFHTQTAQGVGAFTYKGMMIDMPTIKRAENILTRAAACGMKM